MKAKLLRKLRRKTRFHEKGNAFYFGKNLFWRHFGDRDTSVGVAMFGRNMSSRQAVLIDGHQTMHKIIRRMFCYRLLKFLKQK